jgi:hypothetical protein
MNTSRGVVSCCSTCKEQQAQQRQWGCQHQQVLGVTSRTALHQQTCTEWHKPNMCAVSYCLHR